MKPVGKSA